MNKTSNAIKLYEGKYTDPNAPKVGIRKTYGGDTAKKRAVKLRKRLRTEAALLRGLSRTLMLCGIIGGCSLCGMNVMIYQHFGLIGSLIVWGIGLAFSLTCLFVSVCLLTSSQEIQETAGQVGKEV